MKLKSLLLKVLGFFFSIFAPNKWKRFRELRYWKYRKRVEGNLTNHHYVFFYTDHFSIPISYYDEKVILDLGCGPRGSLEWATSAKRRIGLDPLVNQYLKLGALEHDMEYIVAGSENIPLEKNSCDAVFSFNSLDHVEDVDKTIQEIKRVVKPDGVFLLLVEVNHPPTATEPHHLTPKYLIEAFQPEFRVEELRVFRPIEEGLYQSIANGETFADPVNCEEIGYLSAKFVRS